MEKEFVPYELAVKLKELGFNESCFGVFQTQESNRLVIHYFQKSSLTFATHLLPAPTFSQSFRWFREKYDLHHCIMKIHDYFFDKTLGIHTETYEEAELGCLIKLIEIVKN